MALGINQAALSRWPRVEEIERTRSLAYRFGYFAICRYRLCLFLVLCLTVFNFFWHLSTSAISDVDEARYGVSSSEMLQSHSSLVATYAGMPEYWNLKPPLGYWMQELSYWVFGPTVFAMRLPAALCALATVALTMFIGSRWYGRRAGLLAGLILATCFGFVSHHGARSGDLDAALTLIMLTAVIQIPKLTVSPSRRMLWAVMLSLGFLLKSFAITPFLGVTLIYMLWSGDWREIRWREWLPAISLLLFIIFAWIFARIWVDHSTDFVHRMVREDLLGRSLKNIDTGSSGRFNYTLALFDRFAPWPVLIAAALLLKRNIQWRSLPLYSRLVVSWALVPLVGFSLAQTQHHWYLDPSYPAWSLLAANSTLGLLATNTDKRKQALIVGIIISCLVVCEMRLAMRIGVTDCRPANQAFLMSIRDQLPLGETIWVGFPLSHSERFILQVIDGYKVADLVPPEALTPAVTHRVVLLRRRQADRTLANIPDSHLALVGAGYALLTDGSRRLSQLPGPIAQCKRLAKAF
jgi:4-amino-4-deoxy-L-arabinose transferase-like glycosyltransferase